jgi:hypothetical protein
MSAARNYQKFYSKKSDDQKSEDKKNKDIDDKKHVQAYIDKVRDLLANDPEAQKKAAMIISQMINSK